MTREEFEVILKECWIVLRPKLLLVFAFAIVVGGVAYGVMRGIPDRYTSTVTFLAPKQADSLIFVAQSDELFRMLAQRHQLRARYDAATAEGLRRRWDAHVMARKTRDGMVTVAVTDGDPEFAARLANDIAAETQAIVIRQKLSDNARVLADRVNVLNQAREQEKQWNKTVASPEFAAQIGSLPAIERIALEGVARSQAETAAVSQRTSEEAGRVGLGLPLMNQEAVRLQSQLLTVARDSGATKQAMSRELILSVDALQRHVYWQSFAEIMGREVVRLRELALMDMPFDPAPVPVARSGPERFSVAVLAFLGAWLIAAVVLIVRVSASKYRARRDRMVNL